MEAKFISTVKIFITFNNNLSEVLNLFISHASIKDYLLKYRNPLTNWDFEILHVGNKGLKWNLLEAFEISTYKNAKKIKIAKFFPTNLMI